VQDTTVVAKVVSQTLDVLGAKFGATGAHLWQILVKQVYVNAMTATFISLMITGLLVVIYKGYKMAVTQDDTNSQEAFFGVGCFLTVVAVISWAVTSSYVSQTFNPEYGALETVLTAIKGR
jgi:ABC-type sugar transport system permease subunit